jgi:hypothetical protein
MGRGKFSKGIWLFFFGGKKKGVRKKGKEKKVRKKGVVRKKEPWRSQGSFLCLDFHKERNRQREFQTKSAYLNY